MLRKLVPAFVKIRLQLLKRKLKDDYSGNNFATQGELQGQFVSSIELTQEVKRTQSFEAKMQNFKVAIGSIEPIVVKPGEIFSFWKVVGNPTKKNGFAESRSLNNGVLKPSFGGGLCQISGLIYYASLQANLEITERYNHSADIYTEETRFAPIGSDATVVYGYKDLRVKNNKLFPIKFSFSFASDNLTIKLESLEKIKKTAVSFRQKNVGENKVKVETLINGLKADQSTYIKMPV